jgi:glycosyltransferase involved in cell wall biosynthesis
MKIAIINNMAPFLWGGAEELAMHLQKNIIIGGHQAEIIRIPFQWEPPSQILNQMLLAKWVKLQNVDRVIALKFPAYLIEHPHKTLWLLHQYRQAYDLYDQGMSNISKNSSGQALREAIKTADDLCFKDSQAIFTNSKVTQNRLLKYNGFQSEVLLPPVNDPEIFTGGAPKGYIFAGGRINQMKRQYLLVEAMKFTNKNVNLIIGGPPDSQNDADILINLVKSLNLESRVTLNLNFLSREKYAQYINHSNAVAYLPFDEDSLGYVAMESAVAGKPIITLNDSGGIQGLAIPELTGWVSDPSLTSLAEAMTEVFNKPILTHQMGENLREFWRKMGVNWPATIERLLK